MYSTGSALYIEFVRPPPPRSTLFPYTTLFRSSTRASTGTVLNALDANHDFDLTSSCAISLANEQYYTCASGTSMATPHVVGDRKSTRLNSSHTVISYAVFCLKKKKIS